MKNPKKGIISKSILYAYSFLFNKACIGPYLIMITVFNGCDMKCLFCTAHSPILKKKNKQASLMMDFKLFKKIIDEASKFGVSLVEICGNGEPLMHKNIGGMISYIKKSGIACQVTTNGLRLNKNLVKQILNMAPGSRLSVSLNAGTEQVYKLVHSPPCKTAFKKIKFNILMFHKQRAETKSKVGLRLTYIIFKDNYHDIINGVKLAKELCADEIVFKEVLMYPGLERLQLKNNQRKKYTEVIAEARNVAEYMKVNTNLDYIQEQAFLAQDSKFKKDVPCYLGWFYTRIQANGDVLACSDGRRHYSNININTLKEVYTSKGYNYFRNFWDDKKARKGIGYSCDSCAYKMQNVKLDKFLWFVKPLKKMITIISRVKC